MSYFETERDPLDSRRWPEAEEAQQIQMLLDEHPKLLIALRPWFITFNPCYGGARGEYLFYFFEPFPVEEFPANSPLEDHEVVSHYGIGGMAYEAGYAAAEDYLNDMILCAGHADDVISRFLRPEPI